MKLSLLLIPFFLFLSAQPNKSLTKSPQNKMRIYAVSFTGPFTIKVDGKELLSSERPERVTLKTSFIRMDQKLNIYSYNNDAAKGEILIYKNNKLIKSDKGKFPGLKIIQADELGQWAGYIINKDGTTMIIQNSKQAKVQKIGKGETVIGITKQTDVITTVFDSSLSQAIIKKNGVLAKRIKMPQGTIGIQVVKMMAYNPVDITSLYTLLPSDVRPRITNKNECPLHNVKDPACVDNCMDVYDDAVKCSECIKNCPCIADSDNCYVGGEETIVSGKIPTDY